MTTKNFSPSLGAAWETQGYPCELGPYLLLQQLARGGMGDVHLAKQGGIAGIQRYCVVKTLKRKFSMDAEYVQRFVDEARVVVSLAHKNICPVFDVGKAEGRYYLAMEYIAGRDIRTLAETALKQGVVIPPALSMFMVGEVLEALDYAHRATDPNTGASLDLVHRDISPQNMMVSVEGDVKLIDFGLAASTLKEQSTQPHVVMGKLAYMPAEQLQGQTADRRVDLYAAAVTLYELLAGERYYEGVTPAAILPTASTGTFRPRKLDAFDPPLRAIFERALAQRASERLADCGEFKDLLVAYQVRRQMRAGSRDVRRLYEQLFPDDKGRNRGLLARYAAQRAPTSHDEGTQRIAASPQAAPPDSSALDGINELMGMSDDMMRAESEQELVVDNALLGSPSNVVRPTAAPLEKANTSLKPAPARAAAPLTPPPHTDDPIVQTPPTGVVPTSAPAAPPPSSPASPASSQPTVPRSSSGPIDLRKVRPPQLDDDEQTQVVLRQPIVPQQPTQTEEGGQRRALYAAAAALVIGVVVVIGFSGGDAPRTDEAGVDAPGVAVPAAEARAPGGTASDGRAGATPQPAATEPAATEPAATEPAATEPAATEPAATEPAATEPAATEPAATEPAATTPAATTPAAKTVEPSAPATTKAASTTGKPKSKATTRTGKTRKTAKRATTKAPSLEEPAAPKEVPKLRSGAKPEVKIRFLDRFCRKKISCSGKLVDDFRAFKVQDARSFWSRVDACIMLCSPGSMQ